MKTLLTTSGRWTFYLIFALLLSIWSCHPAVGKYQYDSVLVPPPQTRPVVKYTYQDQDYDFYEYPDAYYISSNGNLQTQHLESTAGVIYSQPGSFDKLPCSIKQPNQVEKPWSLVPSQLTYSHSYDYYEYPDPDPPGWTPPPSSPGWAWPAATSAPPPPPPPGWGWPAPPPPSPGWAWPAPPPPPPAPGWGWAPAPAPPPALAPTEPKYKPSKTKSKSKNKGKYKEKAKEPVPEKVIEKGDKGKDKGDDKDKDLEKGKGEKDKDKDDKDKEPKEKAGVLKDIWNKFVDILKFKETFAEFRALGMKPGTESGDKKNQQGTMYMPLTIALRWPSTYPLATNTTKTK